jgi:demethylmenaquinone methyltransferase / 2-methoxy-6-polyprenyl-1,4-benzoquinol methylase
LADSSEKEHTQSVEAMFGRIAPRYDRMNRIMTAGQDLRWRKEAIRRANLSPGCLLLDLGAGTGDLSVEALRQQPSCRVVAVDLTMPMMEIGRQRTLPVVEELSAPVWACANAQLLPFPDDLFDAVVSGFLLRNLHDVKASLADQHRVVRPGGWVVALDTNPTPDSRLAPLLRFHLHWVIPTLGRFIAGHPQEYRYLPASTEGFLQPEQLAERFNEAGFSEVGYQRLMFGTVAVHWGRK